jgi:hypothetical protein
MLAHIKWTVTEARQPVEVIHDVFGMEHALRRIPFDADRLGPLCADCKDHCARTKRAHIIDGQIFAFANADVSKIMDMRLLKQFPVLLSQPPAQFELARKDAIFGKPAELDVAIENDDFMADLPECGGNCHPGWSGTGYDDAVLLLCAHSNPKLRV